MGDTLRRHCPEDAWSCRRPLFRNRGTTTAAAARGRMLGFLSLLLMLLFATATCSSAAAAFVGYSSPPRNHHHYYQPQQQQPQQQLLGTVGTLPKTHAGRTSAYHQQHLLLHLLVPQTKPTLTVLSASLLPTSEMIASSILTVLPSPSITSNLWFLGILNQPHHFNLETHLRLLPLLQVNDPVNDFHTIMLSSTSSSTSSSSQLDANDTGLTWRQIVSLTICGLVLLDIVAGSPVAKGLLNTARPPSMDDEPDQDTANVVDGGTKPNWVERLVAASRPQDAATPTTPPPATKRVAAPKKNPKERVDVEAIAQAALDRAASIQEMKAYRDANKSDWQKIQELQRAVDRQLEEQ